MEFLQWIEDSDLGQFVSGGAYTNLVLLCFHAIGMAMVVGVIWMYNLRILGFPIGMPLSTFRPLTKLGWLGFILNAASGILMFVGAATRLITNLDFQLKMLLIALGGGSMLVLARSIGTSQSDSPTQQFSPRLKLFALASALLWLGAIVFGRQIAYTLARPAV